MRQQPGRDAIGEQGGNILEVSHRRLMLDVRDNNLQETPPMPEALARRLRDYYREDVLLLEGLLGTDLSAWRQH